MTGLMSNMKFGLGVDTVHLPNTIWSHQWIWSILLSWLGKVNLGGFLRQLLVPKMLFSIVSSTDENCSYFISSVRHNVMLTPVPMASHEQKSYVMPHFNHLDLRNAMVPLTIISALCDASASSNGITWPKNHVAPHLNYLDLTNIMVPLMTLLP